MNTVIFFYFPIGFFVELFIVELLMMSPFPKRKLFPLKMIAGFLLIGAFCYWFPPNWWLDLLRYSIIFSASIALIVFSYKISIPNAIFCGVGAYAMQHISGSAVSVIFMQIFSVTYTDEKFWIFFLLAQIPVAISYATLYFVFIKRFHKQERFVIKNKYLATLVVVILLITLILSILYDEFGGRALAPAIMIILKCYVIICCVLSLTIQSGLFSLDKLAREKEILEHLMQAGQKHHEMSKENMELINIKCHDIRHQISSLKTLNIKELKDKYIDELQNSITIYDMIAKTGNKTLDAVLTEKQLLCEKYNVKLSYIADGEQLNFIEPSDLYSLFANALDNAFESVKSLPDENKRLINLNASLKDRFLTIRVENYFESQLVFENNLPKTSKGKDCYHGFGIKSIKFIAEKYKGNLAIDTADNLFSLCILIPVPALPDSLK